MKRENTRKIMVGNVQIGGQNKVVIQSMCNTKTKDIEATVKQILNLEKAGCEIIRVACLDIEDAKAIKEIKKQIHIPIVADIHFDYRIALEAIDAGVDKVRINPGNIGSEERVKMVVDKCKEKNIPIRIGVNGGSLEKDLLEKYNGKPTAKAMVEPADRSIPPEMITNIIPQERIPLTDACLMILIRFRGFANASGEMIISTITSAKNAIKIPNSLKFILFFVVAAAFISVPLIHVTTRKTFCSCFFAISILK